MSRLSIGVSLIKQIEDLNKKSSEYNSRLDNIMKLIEVGDFNENDVNNQNQNALMISCNIGLENVALALIKTGKFNLENADTFYGYTALMFACSKSLENVALELIKTGQSNPGHVSKIDYRFNNCL